MLLCAIVSYLVRRCGSCGSCGQARPGGTSFSTKPEEKLQKRGGAKWKRKRMIKKKKKKVRKPWNIVAIWWCRHPHKPLEATPVLEL